VSECLTGLCFDTTSANTGVNGPAMVIQEAFDKRLLFLVCRHHLFEIIAAAVFDLFCVSYGPQNAILATFKSEWPLIDQSNFVPHSTDTKACSLTVVVHFLWAHE